MFQTKDGTMSWEPEMKNGNNNNNNIIKWDVESAKLMRKLKKQFKNVESWVLTENENKILSKKTVETLWTELTLSDKSTYIFVSRSLEVQAQAHSQLPSYEQSTATSQSPTQPESQSKSQSQAILPRLLQAVKIDRKRGDEATEAESKADSKTGMKNNNEDEEEGKEQDFQLSSEEKKALKLEVCKKDAEEESSKIFGLCTASVNKQFEISNILNRNKQLLIKIAEPLQMAQIWQKNNKLNEENYETANNLETMTISMLSSQSDMKSTLEIVKAIESWRPSHSGNDKTWNRITDTCINLRSSSMKIFEASIEFYSVFLQLQNSMARFISRINDGCSLLVASQPLEVGIQRIDTLSKNFDKNIGETNDKIKSDLEVMLKDLCGDKRLEEVLKNIRFDDREYLKTRSKLESEIGEKEEELRAFQKDWSQYMLLISPDLYSDYENNKNGMKSTEDGFKKQIINYKGHKQNLIEDRIKFQKEKIESIIERTRQLQTLQSKSIDEFNKEYKNVETKRLNQLQKRMDATRISFENQIEHYRKTKDNLTTQMLTMREYRIRKYKVNNQYHFYREQSGKYQELKQRIRSCDDNEKELIQQMCGVQLYFEKEKKSSMKQSKQVKKEMKQDYHDRKKEIEREIQRLNSNKKEFDEELKLLTWEKTDIERDTNDKRRKLEELHPQKLKLDRDIADLKKRLNDAYQENRKKMDASKKEVSAIREQIGHDLNDDSMLAFFNIADKLPENCQNAATKGTEIAVKLKNLVNSIQSLHNANELKFSEVLKHDDLEDYLPLKKHVAALKKINLINCSDFACINEDAFNKYMVPILKKANLTQNEHAQTIDLLKEFCTTKPYKKVRKEIRETERKEKIANLPQLNDFFLQFHQNCVQATKQLKFESESNKGPIIEEVV